MEHYLKNPKELAAKRNAGIEYVRNNTSWEKEAEKVAGYIKNGLAEDEKKITEE
jgi:hypothetical protein